LAPDPVWTTWRSENFCPHRDLNSDPLAVQPELSRYTNCAIPARKCIESILKYDTPAPLPILICSEFVIALLSRTTPYNLYSWKSVAEAYGAKTSYIGVEHVNLRYVHHFTSVADSRVQPQATCCEICYGLNSARRALSLSSPS
jgi:hypothetical protein